ncbi:toll-like receptor 13 [Anoplophora glabripennis]|uniref:toll-like receptor 13 n=1 Tax=Anoplophora glabripennis TaxID=217634 RepID=UPI0008750866|nr:toll-like receptor 13 [Anoplophora glabripennis]
MIKNLPKLKTIYGKNKDIAFVDPWAFWNLPKLEEINLSYNYIKGIDYGSFSKLSSVQTLDLSWNEIEYIGQGSFQGMTSLKRLDLSRNYLNRFDATYYFSLTNSDTSLALEELNLSHNKLKLVVNLNSFLRLHVIDLSHNELSYINWTSNIRTSQWLTNLDLSDNYFSVFDLDLSNVYIDKLRIPFNDLYHPDAINVVARINVVVLDGNLWQCEAYTQLLEKFLKMQTTILDYEEDDDIYFLTKFERENYPTCFFSTDSFSPHRSILLLESTYKTRKNPRCRTKNQCPKDMFCKSGRCWKGCEQNICDETAVCVSDSHGFYCHCPRGKIPNPFVTETRCYNVQCFADDDCRKFGNICNEKTHKCEENVK